MLQATCSYAQAPQFVRVAIIQDAESINLKIKGVFEITTPKENRPLFRGENLKTTVVSSKAGIFLAGEVFDGERIFIKTFEPEAITVNDRWFKGDIQLIRKSSNHLLVVNYIALEDYIKGILYHESSHYWPMEALKAQAVACRTYAAFKMQENAAQDYDVTNDIYSQVYGGSTSERSRSNEAVDATKGQVLKFQGKIFPTYYHATCAGYTEDASNLWNVDLAPLKGVACNFCKGSPHFEWHYVFSHDEVIEKLKDAGYKIKNIKAIEILGRNRSGRVTSIKIITGKEDLRIPAKDFRSALGPNTMRSTNFQVKVISDDIVFEGVGWGHGVGLCQWGAYFMAKDGRSYQEILRYYYPGAEFSVISY